MNSFNHYAYGSIGDWLYRVVAGINIDPEKPGYKHIYINPVFGGDLTFARAEHQSMYGKIRSGWKIGDDGKIQVSIVVPHNTTATVVLPGARLDLVREGGKGLDQAEGILEYDAVDNGVMLRISSGEYLFQYEMKN